MESSGDDEVAVAIDVPWAPTGRSGRPSLFHFEDLAVLVFDLGSRPPTENLVASVRRRIVPTSEAAPGRTPARSEIRFEDCEIATYGYPPGPDRAGHRLSQRGLSGPGLFEVVNSSWVSQLAAQHGAAHPGAKWPPYRLRHFITAFADATFECLCTSVLGRSTDLSLAEVLQAAMAKPQPF